MSKSKGNTVDPFELFTKYGADATRWYLVTTSPPWKPTLFDEDGIVEVQRKFFGTLINTYSFFSMYANIDNFEFKEALIPYNERPEIDRWIISKLSSVISEYEQLMENYDVTKASRLVASFTIDHLSNWYVRRCRRRFWKSEMNKNKISAYQTLYECLNVLMKLISPFAPFISDDLYRNLNEVTKRENFESVHLSDFPAPLYSEKELEAKMDVAQKVVYIARSMRAKNNLKVRQPLLKIMVAVDKSAGNAVNEMKDVILEEVNIKELIVLEDDSEIVNKSAKPNFKSIGPKFGKKANPVANAIRALGKEDIAKLEKNENIILKLNDEEITIAKDDVEIVSTEITGWLVESEEGITVAIDTELTEELIAEGLAREFVNRVQNMRKDAGLEVTDRIAINIEGSGELVKCILNFRDYVMNEVLADYLVENKAENGFSQEFEINNFSCKISINKT
jgi:isoleucyl-tRNA synthetase